MCIRAKLSSICQAEDARLHKDAKTQLGRVSFVTRNCTKLSTRTVDVPERSQTVRFVSIRGREHATPSTTGANAAARSPHLNGRSFQLMIKSRKRDPCCVCIGSNSRDLGDSSG